MWLPKSLKLGPMAILAEALSCSLLRTYFSITFSFCPWLCLSCVFSRIEGANRIFASVAVGGNQCLKGKMLPEKPFSFGATAPFL